MRVLSTCLIALVSFGGLACSDPPAEWPDTALSETGPEAYRSSKADLPWGGDGLTAEWRDAMICAAALGQGAYDGAARFLVGLWNLPGLIADLVTRLGSEVIRRTADLMMSLSDEEALARVRETVDEDKRRLMELMATIRRAIPEMWLALDGGTDWFGQMDRSEKVELICEVTGRIAFEILIVIAGDKGLSKLLGLARVQLVHGVQSHAMRFASVARLAHLSKRAVIDVGSKIAGRREARWMNPQERFGSLAPPETYSAIATGGQNWRGEALPALARWDEASRTLVLMVHTGEWEATPGSGYLDVLLPEGASVPPGAQRLEEGISFVDASNIIQSIESDVRAWGREALDILVEDGTYARYLIPADVRATSQTSSVSQDIEARFRFLLESVGPNIRYAVEAVSEFLDLSPAERVGYLDDLIGHLDASP